MRLVPRQGMTPRQDRARAPLQLAGMCGDPSECLPAHEAKEQDSYQGRSPFARSHAGPEVALSLIGNRVPAASPQVEPSGMMTQQQRAQDFRQKRRDATRAVPSDALQRGRCRAARDPHRRAGPGVRLADPDRHRRCSLRAGRLHRHIGAARGQAPVGQISSALRDREPAWRGGRHRGRLCGQCGARWLHHHVRLGVAAWRFTADPKGVLRSGRVRADLRVRHHPVPMGIKASLPVKTVPSLSPMRKPIRASSITRPPAMARPVI